jgi:hypothetical protein
MAIILYKQKHKHKKHKVHRNKKFSKPHDIIISFCTAVRNWMKYFSVVFPENIAVAREYTGVELCVVDFNSTDGLQLWMKNNVMADVHSGLLSYYIDKKSEYFEMAYCKNVSHKVARGKVVINLDGDNYLTENMIIYAKKILRHHRKNIVIRLGSGKIRGVLGFYKKDFINVLGGYDERFFMYGGDDRDLYNRAIFAGFSRCSIPRYCQKRLFQDDRTERVNEYRPRKRNELTWRKILGRNYANRIINPNKNKEWGKAELKKLR